MLLEPVETFAVHCINCDFVHMDWALADGKWS